MSANDNTKGFSKAEKVGLVLTMAIAIGGIYGNFSDRINAVESEAAVTRLFRTDLTEEVCEQGKKLDVILLNTNDIKSDVQLLKATKADKKLTD